MYKSRDRQRFAASKKATKSSQSGDVMVGNNQNGTPGAIAVQPSESCAATNQYLRSNDSRGSFSDEESHQNEDTPVQGAGRGNDYRFANDAYTIVDARPVHDEDVVYAEIQHAASKPKKWYQRPVYWVSVLAIVLIVVVVMLVIQLKGSFMPALTPTPTPDVAQTSSPTVAPTIAVTPTPPSTVAVPVAVAVTPAPSSLTPEQIACNFIGRSSLTDCQSTLIFNSESGDTVSGSAIPSEIGLLTQLTSLTLWQTGLIGSIPSSIGNLVRLTRLKLDNNALTGTIPSSIGLLTELTFLDFEGNSLRGTIPPSVGNFANLTSLALFDNSFTGSIPSSLCNVRDIWIDCGEIACSCCTDESANGC